MLRSDPNVRGGREERGARVAREHFFALVVRWRHVCLDEPLEVRSVSEELRRRGSGEEDAADAVSPEGKDDAKLALLKPGRGHDAAQHRTRGARRARGNDALCRQRSALLVVGELLALRVVPDDDNVNASSCLAW